MEEKDFFSAFKPKTAFIVGLIGGLLLLFTIGFFVLLAKAMDGDSNWLGSKDKGNDAVAVAGTGDNVAPTPAPAPTGEPVDIKLGDDEHLLGNEKAKVKIVVYSDFQCPFCQRFHPTIKQALAEYGDDVAIIFRHFPLDQLHPNARPAAEASECIAEQKGSEGFWQFADDVFARQSEIGPALYEEIAGDIGVNMNKFKDCVSTGKYKAAVEEDYQSGLSYGVNGTPGNFVNGISVKGAVPYATLKAAIDTALNE